MSSASATPIRRLLAEEGGNEIALDFTWKKTIWNMGMILDFVENEDVGKLAPISIPL
jgi:hypothetical protein